jgi:hypothetical protein
MAGPTSIAAQTALSSDSQDLPALTPAELALSRRNSPADNHLCAGLPISAW